MTLKEYKAFLTAYECGSLSKGAEKLNSTQSALTHLINSFEEELGFSLMTRNKGGIHLTEEGKRILPQIKEIVDGDNKLDIIVKKIKGELKNVITVGTFTSVAVNWLPNIINGFKQLNPNITINIIDGGYNDIQNALEKGEADLGFIALPQTNNFKCYPLVNDNIYAILPKNHILASCESIPVKCFENEPVISLSDSTDQDSRNVFIQNGITPNIKYRTTDDYAMLSMVENNLGICLEPELLLNSVNLKVKALPLNPPAYRTIGLCVPYEKQASSIVIEFTNYVLNWVKENAKNSIV